VFAAMHHLRRDWHFTSFAARRHFWSLLERQRTNGGAGAEILGREWPTNDMGK